MGQRQGTKEEIVRLIPEIDATRAEATAWRHYLHAQPELGFDLPATTAFVEARLREFGVREIYTGVGRSGIVAVIEGRSVSSGKSVGLRADMDALPINEMTGIEYASKHEGRMHACGHDGHTTMLLAAARHLAAVRDFDGRAVLIFQPAEEFGGGGRVMIEDGLFERWPVDRIFGMHNWPGLPVGRFSVCSGPMLAASGRFDIHVKAKGGHAAFPHKCTDPIRIAVRLIDAFDGIVSRETDPLEALVISATKLESGHTYNVIPGSAKLGGTIRALSNDVYRDTVARMGKIAEAYAELYASKIDFDHTLGYPALVNDEEATLFAVQVAQEVVGHNSVDTKFQRVMGAEDFSFMLERVPGAFIAIGNGDGPFLHHPKYNFNDETIAIGASFWCRIVQAAMPLF